MTTVHEPSPMIESLEPRAFCSVTPLTTTTMTTSRQLRPTTSALYVDPKTVQQPQVVIAIIAILIG